MCSILLIEFECKTSRGQVRDLTVSVGPHELLQMQLPDANNTYLCRHPQREASNTVAHAYILIGGNLGNRYANLRSATQALERLAGRILATSTVYETEAWGMEGPAFLNQALQLETELAPEALLDIQLQVERQLGRERDAAAGYQSRTMDIDLLLFDNAVIGTDRLTVPHPRMAERRFVLVPLADIAANVVHPVTQTSIATMLQQCPDTAAVTEWQIPQADEA